MSRAHCPATVLAAAMLSGLVLSAGCRYSTERPFPTNVQTVHVETFQSREFRRDLEFELTEALIKRIEQDTPYRIAPRGTADWVISGEILRVQNMSFGNEFATDLPREIGSTVVVRFRVQDMRTGKIIVEQPRFVYQASYIPSVKEKFDQAMLRAMDGLAERIVETLETSW